MKQSIVAFLCILIFLLSVNYNAVSEVFDEPQKIDQMSIDELKKQIGEYLRNHDFESIVQALPDNLVFGLCNKTKDYRRWLGVKVHSLIMLEQRSEACKLMNCRLMEEAVLYERGIYVIQGVVECLNDNYGNATDAFTRAIELCESPEEALVCYYFRSSVYAARRMHKEAKSDLVKMRELRPQQSEDFLRKFPLEYLVQKYLEDPDDKSFYRYEMPHDDPSKVTFKLYWWCCNLSEETSHEMIRLFLGANEVLPEHLRNNGIDFDNKENQK